MQKQSWTLLSAPTLVQCYSQRDSIDTDPDHLLFNYQPSNSPVSISIKVETLSAADKVPHPIFSHLTSYPCDLQALHSAHLGPWLICEHTRQALASGPLHLHFLLALPSDSPRLTPSPCLLSVTFPLWPALSNLCQTTPSQHILSLFSTSLLSVAHTNITFWYNNWFKYFSGLLSTKMWTIEVCYL